MKQMIKQAAAILLAAFLLIGMIACGGKNGKIPEGTPGSNGLNYVLNDDGTSYSVGGMGRCTDTSVVIPSVYNGKYVTGIRGSAFRDHNEIVSISIPACVTEIDPGTFRNCDGLLRITVAEDNPVYTGIGNCVIDKRSQTLIAGCAGSVIPSDGSVKYISHDAFKNCVSLTELVIPDGVVSIGYDAFRDCTGLTDIFLPESITSIAWDAFRGCSNLKAIRIPDSVTEIGWDAFYDCERLATVTLGSGLTTIGSGAFHGCVSLISISVPPSVTSIGDNAFGDCNKLIEIENRSALNIQVGSDTAGGIARSALNVFSPGNGKSHLTRTDDDYVIYADENVCYLMGYLGTDVKLTLPATFGGKRYEMFPYAFSGNVTLQEISIANGSESIGNGAFYGCSSLVKAEIPASVTTIGNSAFYGCADLELLHLPTNLKRIGKDAFYGCDKLKVTEAGVKYVGKWAVDFVANENFSAVRAGTVGISDGAFYMNTALREITLPDGLIYIGVGAFYGCTALNEIVIPNSVKSMGTATFYQCISMQSAVIGNGVEALNDGTFYLCEKLKTVTIGSGVKKIGEWAFYGCPLSSAVFADPSGWYCANTPDADSGTDLDLSSPERNAGYLINNYRKYFLKSN